ncbi:hypothetical protein SCUCBS95973_009471 [Sporothrix curviconia]|uniref:Uncharacterized protein n=1 Tax=Sporothrix curviconia TaxID=1260050 RepID=A0ABP0CV86_9PEZI
MDFLDRDFFEMELWNYSYEDLVLYANDDDYPHTFTDMIKRKARKGEDIQGHEEQQSTHQSTQQSIQNKSTGKPPQAPAVPESQPRPSFSTVVSSDSMLSVDISESMLSQAPEEMADLLEAVSASSPPRKGRPLHISRVQFRRVKHKFLCPKKTKT